MLQHDDGGAGIFLNANHYSEQIANCHEDKRLDCANHQHSKTGSNADDNAQTAQVNAHLLQNAAAKQHREGNQAEG